jgi:hypothetical protein
MSKPLRIHAADAGLDAAAELFKTTKITLDILDVSEDTYSAHEITNDVRAAFVAAFERSMTRRLQEYLKKRTA